MSGYADRVKETATTTGTGDFTLAGAASGYRAFSSVFAVGDRVYYAIVNGTSEWEIGRGTLSGSSTLARTEVYASTNSNAAVNFSSGTKDVFCTIPANFMNDANRTGQIVALAAGTALA